MLLSFSRFFTSLGAILQIQTLFFTSLFFGLIIAPYIIKKFQKYSQPIRTNGPQNHLLTKKNTPTMGGLIIIIPTIMSSLLFCAGVNNNIWILLFTFVSFTILGGIDDLLKLKRNNHNGLSAKKKLFFQFIIAISSVVMLEIMGNSSKTHFFYGQLVDLGMLYIPFAAITIVGTSNAVNLTDGLDGLVTVPVIISALSLGIMAYLSDAHNFIDIVFFCAALIGSSLSFLWFNAPPAKIFMGDLGSLPVGASLGLISVMIKYEMVFAIIGSLFIAEALSVMIQVAYFKLTHGKRFFLMTPIHHHFEKKGWQEVTIVVRFWIIAIVFSVLALSFYLHTNIS